jgi:hypothetical protein
MEGDVPWKGMGPMLQENLAPNMNFTAFSDQILLLQKLLRM